MYEVKRRSGAWYLLPVLLHLLGGIIAYFVLRCDDMPKARNCLYMGAALTAATVALGALGAAAGLL